MNLTFQNTILPMKDKLLRLALSITLNREDAEDVVQETMIKVWKRRDQWGEIENLEAWTMTILRRTALDVLRQKGRETEDLSATNEADINTSRLSASPNPHEIMMQRERIELIRQLMEQLPEKQRTVMQLRNFEEKSYKEIADIMQITEEQVKVNLFRARQFIKTHYCEQQ